MIHLVEDISKRIILDFEIAMHQTAFEIFPERDLVVIYI